ncbi:hypothetical protein [Cupriavidus sp. RAF12]|uniref:hypothetical protein n=1 Tax=Cupriavidus sp. RAF12 TaxID=3233050 RepID=UPI003F8DDBAA
MPEVRIFAPQGTDPATIGKLNAELSAGTQTREVRDRLLPNGIEPAAAPWSALWHSSIPGGSALAVSRGMQTWQPIKDKKE